MTIPMQGVKPIRLATGNCTAMDLEFTSEKEPLSRVLQGLLLPDFQYPLIRGMQILHTSAGDQVIPLDIDGDGQARPLRQVRMHHVLE